jgi:hypothetical protein
MFRFMQRFGRDSRARGRGTGPMTRVRRRNRRLDCEALESRQMQSVARTEESAFRVQMSENASCQEHVQ